MDRLSAYAERESESESPEERKKSEEEATVRLLENLRIAKETKPVVHPDGGKTEHTNGETLNGDKLEDGASKETHIVDSEDDKAKAINGNENIDGEKTGRSRGIPEDVKLYEIFYDQVTHIVHAQRLPIQDTIALLVSIANLAL